MIESVKNKIKEAVKKKIEINVVPSEKEEFGHYSTNAAFKLAPTSKASSGLARSPFEVAKDLAVKLSKYPEFKKVEAVQPGFVNFWLSPQVLQQELKEILKKKNLYGSVKIKSRKINVEYVSANPTGPLTMANGRGGFYGDVLANVLEKAGHKVTREYYVNDTGNQIKLLGESILAAAGNPPAGGLTKEHYKGPYIKDLAKKLKVLVMCRKNSRNALEVGKHAAKFLLNEIKGSLSKPKIKFDVWFSEDKNLRRRHEFKKTLAFLDKKDLIEEKDGAVWFSGSDAVLIKSDGEPTYLLTDIAYHYDKFLKRKFDLAIDIWGADHHGHAGRLKNGVKALGVDPERLEIIITQMVRLVSRGKEVKISKRKGEFITLDELIKEVGADVARFFFLMHSPDTHMDFDLDLAKERSQKNPVYYTQYAYVRALNILEKSKIKNQNSKLQFKNLKLLAADSEIKLMLELVKLPDVLAETAADYQVHRLTKYALELARAFHNFYEKERVIGAGGELEQARLVLVSATKIVLENLLDILGINKPKKM